MKKIYMTPAVKVAMVKAPQILAGSLGVDTSKETGTQYSKRGTDFVNFIADEDFDDED